MIIKVATYNIAAGLSDGYFKKKNYLSSANIIKSINADIIGLNEVGKALPSYMPNHAEFLAEYCGYKYYRFANAAYFGKYPFGNAVLSKYPIRFSTVIPIIKYKSILPAIYEPRCILHTEIDCGQTVRILSLHLGLFPDEQRIGIQAAANILHSDKIPTVLMGDMNIDNNSKLLAPIKYVLEDACERIGADVKTFPSYHPYKRLDHIFVSKNITAINIYTVNKRASDHLPLIAEIKL